MKKILYSNSSTLCPFKQKLPSDWISVDNSRISTVGGGYCLAVCKFHITFDINERYVICSYDNFKTKLKFVKELIK